MSINTASIVGRVGQEPDVRYFESGTVVCKITVAVPGQKKEAPPNWFNVELWGKTAEVAAQYVKKGSLVGITGSLKFEHWNDRTTGAQRSKMVVKGDRLDLLGSKSDNQQPQEQF